MTKLYYCEHYQSTAIEKCSDCKCQFANSKLDNIKDRIWSGEDQVVNESFTDVEKLSLLFGHI